ncbi:MAG: M42 family metallopeptidase [Oscillospiraceae bacterium]|jgi:putative aminopeptidase FrvX|nr:M42 family metallopeptidase [Oscillospiraceae bacterium]
MKWDVTVYRDTAMEYAKALLAQDSPSGFTGRAVETAEAMARDLGLESRRSRKGNLTIFVPGRDHSKKIGLCAHVDTLGLMVRSVTGDGRLLITPIGGPLLPTLDGEYCRIYTRRGKVYTGTILSLSPAVHVEDDAKSRPRDDKNMAVRIDEVVYSKEDVEKLGIAPGDYVCYDPKTQVTESGFIKSRFLDDKVSAACILTALKIMKDKGQKPRFDTEVTFTVYEEVGHGGATFSPDLSELLAVDMGCIGEELTCTEEQVSICAKDSSGPFDYAMVSRLVELCEENGVDFAVDVYPHYSSDAAVAWKAGNDLPAALIGPGVHASHGMERTHWNGMKATLELIGLYLEEE